MSDRSMLVDVVARILADRCPPEAVRAAEVTGWSAPVWDALADAGLPWVSVPEEAGGSGGTLADACAMLRTAGGFAAPVPLAETGVLGGWLLAGCHMDVPGGPVTVAVGHPADDVTLVPEGDGWILRGVVHRVPWARAAVRVVVLARVDGATMVASVPSDRAQVDHVANLAGEPRETVRFDDIRLAADEVAEAADGVDVDALRVRGALTRASLLAGALQRVSADTVAYANDRHQFGRPIARFQAVQTSLVRIAEQADCATLATEVAIEASESSPAWFEVAAAKIVTGEAAGTVAALSHQVHGAIGMTKEHSLHALTRRLWSWREEFGSERTWSRRLGRHVAASGADQLWPLVATGLVEA